ncbi:hypothetical protein GLYMA_06G090850v4 [Glycine max]|nr:hypothetical protein GLYMA_06G090850v4 [Glycine max]KAH1124926.1 hypothetical protein GYH30_014530 [Glycine max]
MTESQTFKFLSFLFFLQTQFISPSQNDGKRV